MNSPTYIGDKYSRLEILIYATCWLLIFILPFAVETYDVMSGNRERFNIMPILGTEWILFPIFLLFLLNNFVLLPELFFKDRKVWYFAVLIVCFVVLWWLQDRPEPRHLGPRPEMAPGPPIDMFHITNLIIELCVLLANFAIKVYVHSLRRDVLMLNIQKDKIQTELESLKYQISPHFLLNTLNNIQSLIESDPSRAYYTIQGLSRMMRYLLYENNTATVSLQKEVDFMTNFIDLMKIRYPDTVQVSAQFPVDCAGVMVPPLLFISFLENAFKHGVSYKGESIISINISLEHDHLLFKCANSKQAQKPKSAERKGLGIENVRRRLQLIYGEDYELKITDTEHLYVVEIDLPLQAKGGVS